MGVFFNITNKETELNKLANSQSNDTWVVQEMGDCHTYPAVDSGPPQASTKLLGVVPVVLEESLGLIEGALSRRFYF